MPNIVRIGKEPYATDYFEVTVRVPVEEAQRIVKRTPTKQIAVRVLRNKYNMILPHAICIAESLKERKQ